jgi:hypothetical protein
MQRNYPQTALSFLSFMHPKPTPHFHYHNNPALASEIIAEVHAYMELDLFRLLPSDPEVEAMRRQLL